MPQEYLSSKFSKSRRHIVNTWFLYTSNIKQIKCDEWYWYTKSLKEICLKWVDLSKWRSYKILYQRTVQVSAH